MSKIIICNYHFLVQLFHRSGLLSGGVGTVGAGGLAALDPQRQPVHRRREEEDGAPAGRGHQPPGHPGPHGQEAGPHP